VKAPNRTGHLWGGGWESPTNVDERVLCFSANTSGERWGFGVRERVHLEGMIRKTLSYFPFEGKLYYNGDFARKDLHTP